MCDCLHRRVNLPLFKINFWTAEKSLIFSSKDSVLAPFIKIPTRFFRLVTVGTFVVVVVVYCFIKILHRSTLFSLRAFTCNPQKNLFSFIRSGQLFSVVGQRYLVHCFLLACFANFK